MNRRQRSPQPRIKNPAYRQAFEHLDTALDENTPSDYSEKIRLMRIAMFADVEKLEESGNLKMPKQ